MIWRALVIIAGVAVVAVAAHLNVLHAGGYSWSGEAPLIIAMALLLTVAMGYVGILRNDGRRLAAVLLGVCALAGEIYWMALNADREIASREALAAPLATATEARAAALRRLAAAEAAKVAADNAALEKSAEDGCRKNCAALLLDAKDKATAELTAARAAAAQLPEARSSAPLAEHLGITPRSWDLFLAALRSIAIVGGSLAVGIALHPAQRRTVRAAEPHEHEPASATDTLLLSPVVFDKREHVAKFLRATIQPAPDGGASLKRLHGRYVNWCRALALEPLPAGELGRELRAIVDAAGLECERTPNDVIVRGAAITS